MKMHIYIFSIYIICLIHINTFLIYFVSMSLFFIVISICLSIYLSIKLSICFFYVLIYIFVHLSIYQYYLFLSIYLPLYLFWISIYPSFHPKIHQCIYCRIVESTAKVGHPLPLLAPARQLHLLVAAAHDLLLAVQAAAEVRELGQHLQLLGLARVHGYRRRPIFNRYAKR